MNLWFGKAAFIAGFFAVGYFRDPHARAAKKVKVVDNRKSRFDIALVVLAATGGTLVPVIWIIFDIWRFADYHLYLASFAAGLLVTGFGLWLLKKSHDDLGTNWSVSLELKESHQIVDRGAYKRIRHPMYTSLFLYCLGQIFFIPNWIVGPLGVLTFIILYLCRIGSEEKMMLDQFGDKYRAYIMKTKRLVPGLY